MAKARNKGPRRLLYSLILIALLLGAMYKIFGPGTGNCSGGEFLYVHTGAGYSQMRGSLEQGGFVSDLTTFDLLATIAKLPSHVHPGKYRIGRGMSIYSIVRMLHAGRQVPVKIVINKIRTRGELIGILSAGLEADSASLEHLLTDSAFLAHLGVDTNTLLCAIMPDTYDFFWNTSAGKALNKIHRNYVRFWDSDRAAQAHAVGLSPLQAITLASIVDEETNAEDDKPVIASVYLNRLHKGMKLQADPTVRYAIGDFAVKRITGEMLAVGSPYNTYVHDGLPPGPICTPAQSSVLAVLHAPKTNYLYFCAKDDFSGRSVFASSFDEQLKNARAYQHALDARGIH